RAPGAGQVGDDVGQDLAVAGGDVVEARGIPRPLELAGDVPGGSEGSPVLGRAPGLVEGIDVGVEPGGAHPVERGADPRQPADVDPELVGEDHGVLQGAVYLVVPGAGHATGQDGGHRE